MKRTPLRRAGKKTLEWAKVRRQLVAEFTNRGIATCEFNWPGCMGTFGNSFAHAVKRRFLKSDAADGDPEHIKTVALACASCHQKIERLSHEQMRAAVMDTIARRSSS